MPGDQTGTGSVSYANYLHWKAQSKSLDFAISSYASSANLVGNGDPERISIAGVGADAFPILGVKPIVGRTFAAGARMCRMVRSSGSSASRSGSRFNRDRSIIGKPIVLGRTPTTVIGVLPAVTFPSRSVPIDA